MGEALKKITFMGREIRIREVSLKKLAKLAESTDILGFYSPIDAMIYLADTLDRETFQRVLLHELMHATLSLAGVSNLLKSKREEAVCDAAEHWINLFQDPEFLAYLNKP